VSDQGVRALSPRALALAAGPLGLRDVPFQFSIPAVHKRGVHLRVDLVFGEVDRELHVRAVERHLRLREPAEPLPDFAVELRLERLARVVVEPGFLAEQRLVLLDQRRGRVPTL